MALAVVLNRRRQVPAEDSPAFGAIAERFRRAGELERAVALCQEGLQKYPRHLSARVTLGWALLDLGRYDEARTELEKVLKRSPDNLAAIRGLAQLHDRTEHDDLASIQAEPSEWAEVEAELEQAAGEQLEDAAEATVETETFEAEPGPWVGVQDGLLPTPAQAPPGQLRGVVEPSKPALVHEVAELPEVAEIAEISEVDALAAQLLEVPDAVVQPAAALAEVGELLDFVPASAAPVDDGFIPDDGPGPWPPVFEEEVPQSAATGVWPPVELRQAVRCAPAVVVEPARTSQPQKAEAEPARPGLLSKLGSFRRRVESRRRTSVSEVVAG